MEDLEIRGRLETTQTAASLRSDRIKRRILETCCYSDSSKIPSVIAGVKKSNKNSTHKLLWDFNIQTEHLIPARRPNLIIINKKKKKKKKKRNRKIVDFAVPADNRIKLKECEKKEKYLDLARELKKMSNIQVTIIPIVIGAFSTVTKGLLKGLEDLEFGGRVETIQTTAII